MLRGRIWPDGSWGLGFERKLRTPPPQSSEGPSEDAEFWGNAVVAHGVAVALQFKRELEGGVTPLPNEILRNDNERNDVEAGSPLTLSESINSHKRLKRGTHGISSYGRKMVRSAGVELEKRFDKRNLTFATLTVPHQSVEAWQIITREWSEICRQIVQFVRRELERSGVPALIVHCTELQSSRLERYSLPGLHLHLVWPNSAGKGWAVGADRLRQRWGDILNNSLPSCYRCYTHQPRVELSRVRKSVAGYLSKYLSKGLSQSELASLQLLGYSIPASWWGCSLSLKRIVKKSVKTLGNESGNAILTLIRNGIWKGKVKEHVIDYMGNPTLVGFYGYLADWGDLHELHSLLDSERNRDTIVDRLKNTMCRFIGTETYTEWLWMFIASKGERITVGEL